MRILITGGGGFIGTHLAKHFKSQGYEVALVDTFKYDPHANQNFLLRVNKHRSVLSEKADVFKGDVCDLANLLEICGQFKPTHIVNLASISLALGAEHNTNEALDLSTTAIKNLFSVTQVFDVDRIIHFSSSYVYGNFQPPQCNEEHPQNPINVYGRTKQVSEVLCRTLSEAFSQRSVLIRPISVYGVADLNGKLSATNIAQWIGNSQLRLNGGPDRVNTLTHLDDVARAIELVLTADEACGETFNISSDEHLTNSDIQSAFQRAGHLLELAQPNDGILKTPARGRVSIDKIRSFGFKPQELFERHIYEMIRFALER